ncbi:MAG: hypothetical protein K0R49_78 [Burkholderiales bacterium]|jgi:hypothetical protein|nr:hypothetical protein [Burkholderiales bacterium]
MVARKNRSKSQNKTNKPQSMPQKPPLKVKDIRQFGVKQKLPDSLNGINKTLQNFQNIIFDMIPDLSSNQKDALATAIPYMYNIIGDFITNPSSVSISTFQRMAYTDPIIANGLEVNSALIARSIGPFYHENIKIQELVRYNLKHLKGGLQGLIKDMLSAKWAGYFIGEKVVDKEALKTGKYLISHVTPMPPITTLFAVDEQGDVKQRNGVFQYIINANTNYQNMNMQGFFAGGYNNNYEGGNGLVGIDPLASMGDLSYPERQFCPQLFGLVEIPRDKCIHYVNRSIDNFNNPYGRSILRRIYNIYLLKYGIQQFMALALQFRAFPQMVIYTDGQQQIQDDNGNVTTNYDVGLKVAEQREGTGTFVLPGMKGTSFDVQAVDVTGELQVFIQILQFYDQEIYKGLGIPPSLFDNNGGSYAMGYMHDSLHSKVLGSTIDEVGGCLINQLVADIIDKNFNKSEYDNYGMFKERTLTLDDKLKFAKLFESARNTGICSTQLMDDLNRMREILDFSHTDKPVPQDVTESAQSGDTGNKNTNMRNTRDDTSTPYSHWN